MRNIILLSALFFIFYACGVRRENEIEYTLTPAVANEMPSPTPEDDFLKVQKISVKALNKQQQKELDSTLPPKVRAILEKAEVFEVLGLSSEDKAGIGWYPDINVNVPGGAQRSELLNSFYFDASAGPNPSACFIPRHGLKATYKNKTIEVIICYQCHLFVVEGDLGKFNGGFYKEGSAAHHLFENLLRTKRE